MKRHAPKPDDVYRIISRGETVIKPALYRTIASSADYQRYIREKNKTRWNETKKWLEDIGCFNRPTPD